ncbi:Hypp7950 [Branchiostoma lanceolatum]|uniref:Hypp7950 protein n=1 Tax=Branchiostoma lanceolatum TaxID=7740 RepID=A0A8J9Z5P1_BRALA|nr:Hypp7950 [Branchiostoma lanceolatum]
MAYLCKAKCKNIFQNSTEGFSVQNRPNNIDDFDLLSDKTAVANPGRFFREHGGDYYVLCADRQLGALVLVRPKEGTDLKESPFLREVK